MQIVHAAIAIIHRDTRVLMLKRRDDDRSYPGRWCFPGGRIDPGESPAEAVVREVREETGLSVTPESVALRYDSPLPERARIYRITAFNAPISGGTLMTFPGEEHSEARWIEPAEALDTLALAGPVTQRLLQALVT